MLTRIAGISILLFWTATYFTYKFQEARRFKELYFDSLPDKRQFMLTTHQNAAYNFDKAFDQYENVCEQNNFVQENNIIDVQRQDLGDWCKYLKNLPFYPLELGDCCRLEQQFVGGTPQTCYQYLNSIQIGGFSILLQEVSSSSSGQFIKIEFAEENSLKINNIWNCNHTYSKITGEDGKPHYWDDWDYEIKETYESSTRDQILYEELGEFNGFEGLLHINCLGMVFPGSYRNVYLLYLYAEE